jgi:cytoskeleton protein RodZ
MQDPEGTVTEDDRGDNSGNLGLILQAARNAKGVTLEGIAAELRIEARLLVALEEGRFADLGPPVFAKGYLRQYGSRLGLDYKDLLAEYYRLVEPQEVSIAPSRTIKLRDERQITAWVIAALVIALLGVFLFVWLVDEPAVTPVRTVDPIAPLPDLSPPADAGSGLPLPVDETPVVVEAPAAIVDRSVGETPPDGEIPTEAAAAPSAVAAPSPASALGPAVRIDMAFREDCWVEITDTRGARLFYGLGRAGSVSSVTAEVPAEVNLGNFAGVELTVDGAVFNVPIRSRQGNRARFTLNGSLD